MKSFQNTLSMCATPASWCLTPRFYTMVCSPFPWLTIPIPPPPSSGMDVLAHMRSRWLLPFVCLTLLALVSPLCTGTKTIVHEVTKGASLCPGACWTSSFSHTLWGTSLEWTEEQSWSWYRPTHLPPELRFSTWFPEAEGLLTSTQTSIKKKLCFPFITVSPE